MVIEPGKTYRSRRAWRLERLREFPADRLVVAAGRALNSTGSLVNLFQDVESGSCKWNGTQLLIHELNLDDCLEEVSNDIR